MLPLSTLYQHANKPPVIIMEYLAAERAARDRFSLGNNTKGRLKAKREDKTKSLEEIEVYGAHRNNKP